MKSTLLRSSQETEENRGTLEPSEARPASRHTPNTTEHKFKVSQEITAELTETRNRETSINRQLEGEDVLRFWIVVNYSS